MQRQQPTQPWAATATKRCRTTSRTPATTHAAASTPYNRIRGERKNRCEQRQWRNAQRRKMEAPIKELARNGAKDDWADAWEEERKEFWGFLEFSWMNSKSSEGVSSYFFLKKKIWWGILTTQRCYLIWQQHTKPRRERNSFCFSFSYIFPKYNLNPNST